MASTISAGTTSGTAIAIAGDTSGALALQTNNGTTAMTINTSQNVGIGTTTPATIATGHTVVDISAASGKSANIYIHGDGTSGTSAGLQIQSSTGDCGFYQASNIPMAFATNNTERMRIDTSGNLLVGTTSTLLANCNSFVNNTTAGNAPQLIVRNAQSTAGNYWKIGATADASPYMIVYNASNAGVYMGYGSTGWSGSSDETLKENLTPIENAIDKVNTLRTVIGNFIADEEKTKHPFLIAQDLEKVLPEAVSKNPDGKLGIAYTDVIPLLVASIKELNAKVDAQALEIQALKGVA